MKHESDLFVREMCIRDRQSYVYTTSPEEHIWRARVCHLFISLKNRRFTKDFILWFIDICTYYNGDFDTPFAESLIFKLPVNKAFRDLNRLVKKCPKYNFNVKNDQTQ